MKKLLHGVGYNSGGIHVIREGNRKSKVYTIWAALLQRCYSKTNKLKHPTYEGCYVCSEWHDFQNFAEWYVNHKFYGLGYHLDKDLLVVGNKVYSPQTCTLVPRIINNITLSSQSSRGTYLKVFIMTNKLESIRRR